MATDFSKYGKPVAQGAAAPAPSSPSKYGRPVEPKVSQETEQDGALESIFKGIVKPVATMVARPFQAGAAVLGADADQIDAFTKKIAGDYVAPTPRSGTDVVKDVGRGIETVALGLGGGAGKTAVQTGLKSTLGTAVKKGAWEGTKAGAVGGFGAGLEDEGTLAEAGKQALIGAGTGGVLGGGLAGAGRGYEAVRGGFARRAAEKADEVAKVASKAPDATVATKMANETGERTMIDRALGRTKEVVDDPMAKEAIKQGFKEADVAYIKNATPEDSQKMLKMLEIRQKGKTDRLFGATNRASDVSGETGMSLARHLETKNREAGQKLNEVAKALAGRRVDPSKAISSFGEGLDGHGVSIGKGGALNYKGSDFEGLPGVQKVINKIWERTLRAAKTGDAHQLHRLKTFIDENVNYGKEVEGLSGRAERLLKGLRKGVDSVLDENFPAYNKVNTQFADTITQMNKLADSLGVDFKLGKEFADKKMGTALRKLLSNREGRAAAMQALQEAQKIAKSYGYKNKEDILTQSLFADTLEEIFGSEAPTSFLGQGERFMNQAGEVANAGSELARGNLVSGTIKAGKFLIDATRGVNEENKLAALRALIERNVPPAKAKTVFGRAK